MSLVIDGFVAVDSQTWCGCDCQCLTMVNQAYFPILPHSSAMDARSSKTCRVHLINMDISSTTISSNFIRPKKNEQVADDVSCDSVFWDCLRRNSEPR